MGRHFAELAFTPLVQAEQARIGSRGRYAQMAAQGRDDSALGPPEAEFLEHRDSFYMATVSETGWPYVQHRGGPPGFVRLVDERTLGFADLGGNRQHISMGNLRHDDRVSLFFMDYANRRRLKILGRVRVSEDPDLLARVTPDGTSRAERAVLITVEGFDWNCPQHITQRFTVAELAPVTERLQAAEAEIVRLRALLAEGAGTVPAADASFRVMHETSP